MADTSKTTEVRRNGVNATPSKLATSPSATAGLLSPELIARASSASSSETNKTPSSKSPTAKTSVTKQTVQNILSFERPEVHERIIPPAILRLLVPLFYGGAVCGVYAVPFLLGFVIFATGVIHRAVGLIIMLLSCFFIYQRVETLSAQKIEKCAHDLPHLWKDQPAITALPCYKDPQLMQAAWATSPFRRAYLRQSYYAGALDRETAFRAVNELDRQALRIRGDYKQLPELSPSSPLKSGRHIDEVIVYQPIEGYCAQATANTIQTSIPKHPVSPFDLIPKPVSLKHFERSFAQHENNVQGQKIRNIQPLAADGEELSLQKFTELVLMSVDARYRIAVNFLRGPLFRPNPQTSLEKFWFLLGGHWSPIAGYVWDSTSKSLLVLVLDVNKSYGPFLVPIKRLYEACHSRDDAGFRGMVLVELEPDKL